MFSFFKKNNINLIYIFRSVHPIVEKVLSSMNMTPSSDTDQSHFLSEF